MSEIAFKFRMTTALEDVPDHAAEEVVRAGFWRAREVAPRQPVQGAPLRCANVVDLGAWKHQRPQR